MYVWIDVENSTNIENLRGPLNVIVANISKWANCGRSQFQTLSKMAISILSPSIYRVPFWTVIKKFELRYETNFLSI